MKAGLGPNLTEALSTESHMPRTISLMVSYSRENIQSGGESIIAEKALFVQSAESKSVRGAPSADRWSIKESERRAEPSRKAEQIWFVAEAVYHTPPSHPMAKVSSPGKALRNSLRPSLGNHNK